MKKKQKMAERWAKVKKRCQFKGEKKEKQKKRTKNMKIKRTKIEEKGK